MARVTPDELKATLQLPTADTTVLTGFLDDAYMLVEETLVNVSPKPKLSEARIDVIAKYLAAHLYLLTVEKGGLTLEKVGDSSNMYATTKNGDAGIGSTRFGQLALGMDTSGLLQAIATGKKTAQFRLA
jgi:hypothetical protein